MLRGPILPLLFIYFFAQFAFRNELPRGVHQWAQADRYAIAAHYAKGNALLNPATYSQISDEGAVGVEFPLPQFISGKLAQFIGFDHLAMLYRSLNFLLLFIGFYRLAQREFTKHKYWHRALWIVFWFSSPLLLFYGHNFSPDAAALGMLLLGLSYFGQEGPKPNYELIAAFALAALIKTSAGIYLIAYALYLVWQHKSSIQKPKLRKSLIVIAALITLIAFYDKYFVMERNLKLWSTLFLAQTAPLSNLSQVQDFLKALWHWKFEYLNGFQWALLLLSALYVFFRRLRLQNPLFYLLIFAGIFSILLLFGNQFINHDYYALATFMPFLLWCGFKLSAKLPRTGIPYSFALIVLCILSFSYGSNQHFDRMSENCSINSSHYQFDFEWMKNNAAQIQSEIPADEMLFVVYGLEPNLSLSYFDRSGIVFNHEEMSRQESNFYYWLERRKPKYTLVRQQYAALFKKQHAAFYESCSLLIDHPDFVLLKNHGH